MASNELMMALLSLDAYNRSTSLQAGDVALYGLGGVGATLGGATVEYVQNEAAASFVAVNYSWNGKTVLAFRGTDNLDASNILSSDIWNGWTIGAGWNEASQAKLAQDFYTSQTGLSLFEEASSDVILTGHSLGGGLAGYLSALNGTKAYGFDHMTFGPAAEATVVAYLNSLGITDPTEQDYAAYGLRLPDASQFIGTHVEGEVLEGVRNGTYAMAGAAIAGMYSLLPANFLTSYAMGATWLLARMGLAQQAYESSVTNSTLLTYGWDPGVEQFVGTPRHSQALLVLLQYAKEQTELGDWSSSGFAIPLLNALYKDGVATSVGIVQDGPSDLDDALASGRWSPHDLMMSKIAYSVLDNQGALYLGISYVSEHIGELLHKLGRGTKVNLVIDPEDLGDVFMQVPLRLVEHMQARAPMQMHGEFLEVPAADDGFRGVTLAERLLGNQSVLDFVKQSKKEGDIYRISANEALGEHGIRLARRIRLPTHALTQADYEKLVAKYRVKARQSTGKPAISDEPAPPAEDLPADGEQVNVAPAEDDLGEVVGTAKRTRRITPPKVANAPAAVAAPTHARPPAPLPPAPLPNRASSAPKPSRSINQGDDD